MQKNKLFNITLLLICLGFVAACQEKTKSKTTVKYEYINNPNTDNSGRDTDDDEDSGGNNGSGLFDPILIPSTQIIFNPAGNSSTILWSTKRLPSSYDQSALSTNSKLRIKVRPRYFERPSTVAGRNSAPTGFSTGGCHYEAHRYSTLDIQVDIAPYSDSSAVGFGQTQTFMGLKEGEWSSAKTFTPPAEASFEVQLKNVKWVQSSCPYMGTANENYCYNVWSTECISLDIKIVTDSTNDF